MEKGLPNIGDLIEYKSKSEHWVGLAVKKNTTHLFVTALYFLNDHFSSKNKNRFLANYNLNFTTVLSKIKK